MFLKDISSFCVVVSKSEKVKLHTKRIIKCCTHFINLHTNFIITIIMC